MLKAGTWTKVAVVLMFKLFFSMQHLSSLGPSLKPKVFFTTLNPIFSIHHHSPPPWLPIKLPLLIDERWISNNHLIDEDA
jgi:hypothetical protein